MQKQKIANQITAKNNKKITKIARKNTQPHSILQAAKHTQKIKHQNCSKRHRIT